MGGAGCTKGMSATITVRAPASSASASLLAFSAGDDFPRSAKMADSAAASVALPGNAVVPAAVGPIQAMACQNPVTPCATRAPAAGGASADRPPWNPPRRIAKFAEALVGNDAADDSAELA